MIWHNGIEINTRMHTISHGMRVERFRNPQRFTLLKHMILAPHSADSLFNLLYGNDVDGGPLGGRNHILVMLAYAKPTIVKLRLRLTKRRAELRVTHYHLIPEAT